MIAPIRNDVASRLNGFLWARTILVPAITRGWSRRALWDVKMADVVVAVLGETSVEVVLPEGRGCLQLYAAPVGRWSLWWMPLAPLQTAISPMMARFGRLPADAHTGCGPS